jgi:hypothetical protein
MATIDLSIEKISTIIGIVGALGASVGSYFVMEERQSVLMAEVQVLRDSTGSADIIELKTKIEDLSSMSDAIRLLSTDVAALNTRIADSNPAEFTRKVERLEVRVDNIVKSIDKIQDNDNPLTM